MIKRILIILMLLGAFAVLPGLLTASQSPLFGPKKFLRYSGGPTAYSDTFESCNTAASYIIVIENGQAGDYTISSASITLNGVEIVRQNEFNQNVNRIEKPVALSSQNTLNIKIASGPDAFMHVSFYCTANCLEIKITSPADRATVDRARTIVKGDLYNTYGETGMVVKSSGAAGDVTDLAQASGYSFAGITPLQPGTNTITATATDACGYQAEDAITVNTNTVEEPVRLTAVPSSGILSSTTGTFDLTLDAGTNINNPVANYSWDLNGDGVPEMEGDTLSSVTANYANVGLYSPTVTVTDTLGNKYMESAIVNILSGVEIDALLKGKWDGMKGGLVSGNVDKAISFFEKGSQEAYRSQFTALKPVLNVIGTDMGQINLVKVEDNRAEYELITTRNGVTYSFHLLFVRGKDGVWKIRVF